MTNYNHSRTVSWELDRDFTGSTDPIKGTFCIRVNILRLEFPKYSYMFGWLPPSGNPDEFRVFFQQDHDITDNLGIVFEVLDYIKEKLAESNAIKVAKEEASASNRSQKKKQYEANVQARRVQNRARTETGKKGNKSAIT